MKYIGRLFRIFLYSFMLWGSATYSQDPAQYGTPFKGVPDPRDAVIYQVNMRCFSSTRNFQGVINRLDKIKALGVNVIYLMPVQPIGTLKAFDSPYCIKDFTSVGSEFGSLADLRSLVDSAHSLGMTVIMDWVQNQTSWDHPWITAHKNWYKQDAGGNILQFSTYTDVAALDFSNAAMCAEMINDMRYWVFTANIDGFRCDGGDNPPITFWQQAITSLRGITSHKLLFLSEGTRGGNFTAGFDFNFAFDFYSNLKKIYNNSLVTIIDDSNISEYSSAGVSNRMARYLTNHDVYGSDGSPFNIFGGKSGTLAAFVVTTYMKSVPFIYNGIEVGNTVAMPFPFNSSVINWTEDVSVTPEMTNIIVFYNSSDAIRRGTLTSYDNADVCAFKKVSESDSVFVLVNLRNVSKIFTLPSGIKNTTMKDAFTGVTVSMGTSISLNAYEYKVFAENKLTAVPIKQDVSSLPRDFALSQNFPNPFNPSTKIRFGLPLREVTKLIIYDILGREVSVLVNKELEAGYHEVEFNAINLASGVYFYKLNAGNFSDIKKFVLMK